MLSNSMIIEHFYLKMTAISENKLIFRDLNPDHEEPEASVVESICMNCYKSVRFVKQA